MLGNILPRPAAWKIRRPKSPASRGGRLRVASFQPPGSETKSPGAEIGSERAQPSLKMQRRLSERAHTQPQPRPSAFARVTFKPHRRPDGELKPAEDKAGWETSKDSLDVAMTREKAALGREASKTPFHSILAYWALGKAPSSEIRGRPISVEH